MKRSCMVFAFVPPVAKNGCCVLFSNDVNLCNKAMMNGIKAFNYEVCL